MKRFHSSSFISAKKRRRENSYEDLETGRVSSQFEESQDADDGEELENIRIIHMVSQLLESVFFFS